MWENGSYKPRNLEAGISVAGDMSGMAQFCFAMEIRGSARRILGSPGKPRGIEGRGEVLTSPDISSLVIDRLCHWARGQNVAVACFYFDFGRRKRSNHRRACWAPCSNRLWVGWKRCQRK